MNAPQAAGMATSAAVRAEGLSKRYGKLAAVDGLNPTERTVAEALLDGARTVDAVVALTDLPVATVLATLTLLERRGVVVGRHGRFQPDGDLLGPRPVPKPR